MAKYALLRLRHNQPEPEPVTEVNIIPVIDISLVLLVILFVTAPLLSYPSLPVALPTAHAPASDAPTIAVTCTKDEKLAVRAASADWATLAPSLRAALADKPDAVVLLRVDRAVPYRTVERLMAAANEAGAKRVAVGTEEPR